MKSVSMVVVENGEGHSWVASVWPTKHNARKEANRLRLIVDKVENRAFPFTGLKEALVEINGTQGLGPEPYVVKVITLPIGEHHSESAVADLEEFPFGRKAKA